MAIYQQKRESLLLEATAYSRRILISLHNVSFRDVTIGELFAGVRPDGRWSLYFDESPAIQFDQQESLRSVYIADKKLAAAGGSLVELVRLHQGGKVQHTPQLLDEPSQSRLVYDLKNLLARTCQVLKLSQSTASRSSQEFCRIVGVIPSDDQKVYDDLLSFLSRRQVELTIASSL